MRTVWHLLAVTERRSHAGHGILDSGAAELALAHHEVQRRGRRGVPRRVPDDRRGARRRADAARPDRRHGRAREPRVASTLYTRWTVARCGMTGGTALTHGCAASNAAAARSTAASPRRLPTICNPTGRPAR